MNGAPESAPDDLASRALRLHGSTSVPGASRRGRGSDRQASAASAEGARVASEALIARLKLEIEKLSRELYGSRSERKARLLEQMELQLEDLEADAGEDETGSERSRATQTVRRWSASGIHASTFAHRARETVAPAAARPSCRSSARTSPRRWR